MYSIGRFICFSVHKTIILGITKALVTELKNKIIHNIIIIYMNKKASLKEV